MVEEERVEQQALVAVARGGPTRRLLNHQTATTALEDYEAQGLAGGS